MKRLLPILFVVLLTFTLVLASCGNASESSAETSDPTEKSAASSEGQSLSAEESVASEEPAEPSKDSVEIVYVSYSEKPYGAVVGRCAEGAVVTAKSDNDESSALSWHGWFSVRIKCPRSNTAYTFTQTVDGKQVGDPITKKLSPVTPSSDMWPIVTGYDSQLFLQKMLPDFRHTNLPADSAFNSFSDRVAAHLKQLRTVNENAEIIYMIAPASMTVYPELVPEQYKQGAGKSKLDRTLEAAKKGGATVIDLRTAFAEHKNDEMPLYYKFDSHWTEYGAFVAYTELFEHIAERFPASKPRAIDEFDWQGKSYESGDMVYYLQMEREVVHDYGYLRTMKFDDDSGASKVQRYLNNDRLTYSDYVTWDNTHASGDTNKPNAYVMRDSYSTQIYDILAERFNKTHYVGMWGYSWNFAQISKEKPDYVIYLIAEWNIDSILYS
ncbi:MAG: hypothetical protein KBS45_04180 [Clostridiales bacterium]|nr:hypothetical protein [Candidatus Coliplasma caballi]